MGRLVARHYRTKQFLKLADHTYVECGTGARGWHCKGGKSGGAMLSQATGSTAMADMLAMPDEFADVGTYLVDGVCHQAANRILLATDQAIAVRDARGYRVSEAVYGAYGRKTSAQYWQWVGSLKAASLGDFAACSDPTPVAYVDPFWVTEGAAHERQYLARVRAFYEERSPVGELTDDELVQFQTDLFALAIERALGPDSAEAPRLLDIRREAEAERVRLERTAAWDQFVAFDTTVHYVDWLDDFTIRFQDQCAEVLSAVRYESLFEMPREERVVLADRSILNALHWNLSDDFR